MGTTNQIYFFKYLQLWDEDLVRQISSIPVVQRVVALGTLCALELRAEGRNAGYCLISFYELFEVSCSINCHCSSACTL